MKLPIKKKYFDDIKVGKKKKELRDAHITFVCEETGEQLRCDVDDAYVIDRSQVIPELFEEGVLEDDKILCFRLK